MSGNKDQLKALLNKAEAVCIFKQQRFEANFGMDNPTLLSIQKARKHAFTPFKNPAIWALDLPFDQQKITGFVNKIDALPPTDISQFQEATNALVDYINEKSAKAGLSFLLVPTINSINALALSWTTQIATKVETAEHNIANLKTDPKFVDLQPKVTTASKTYRDGLMMDDGLSATNGDLQILESLNKGFRDCSEVPKFLSFYESYLQFLNEKIDATA